MIKVSPKQSVTGVRNQSLLYQESLYMWREGMEAAHRWPFHFAEVNGRTLNPQIVEVHFHLGTPGSFSGRRRRRGQNDRSEPDTKRHGGEGGPFTSSKSTEGP